MVSSALAAIVVIAHTTVAGGICIGERVEDRMTYKEFIEATALPRPEKLVPAMPEDEARWQKLAYKHYVKRWSDQVKAGQKNLCGKISNNW